MTRKQDHHQSKRGQIALLIVPVLLVAMTFLLGGCGQPPSPWGYVWTNATTIETLSWQVSETHLTGNVLWLTFVDVPFPQQTQPDETGVAYSGTMARNQVQFTIGGRINDTGTQRDNGATLLLSGIDPVSFQPFTRQTWVAVTREQQIQLQQAFTAFGLVHEWLNEASSQDRQETPWHDPNTFTLQATQQLVSSNQALLHQMQATADQQARCQLAHTYTPIGSGDSAFLHDDSLVSDVDALTASWKKAAALSIPHLPASLSLPWLLSSAAYQQASASVVRDAQGIRATLQQDQTTMQALAQTDHQTGLQISALTVGCPPMPS